MPVQELLDLDVTTASAVADPANETEGWLFARGAPDDRLIEQVGSVEALTRSISDPEEGNAVDDDTGTTGDEGAGDSGGDAGSGDEGTTSSNDGGSGDTGGDTGGDSNDSGSDAGGDSTEGDVNRSAGEEAAVLRSRIDEIERARKAEVAQKDSEIAEVRRSNRELQLRLDVQDATEEIRRMGKVPGDLAEHAQHLVLLRATEPDAAKAYEAMLRSTATAVDGLTSERGTSNGDSAGDGSEVASVMRSIKESKEAETAAAQDPTEIYRSYKDAKPEDKLRLIDALA